jgi:hypothetical protein
MQDKLAYDFVFILRIWCAEKSDGPLVWCFALEDTSTGERYGFNDMGAVVAYLNSRMAIRP